MEGTHRRAALVVPSGCFQGKHKEKRPTSSITAFLGSNNDKGENWGKNIKQQDTSLCSGISKRWRSLDM